MRVNVYAEELTDRVEIVSKKIDGHTFTGVRFYLELPCTINARTAEGTIEEMNVSGPFIHKPGDDDSGAVTFWGKQTLRPLLVEALRVLDEHLAHGQALYAKVCPRCHGTQVFNDMVCYECDGNGQVLANRQAALEQ